MANEANPTLGSPKLFPGLQTVAPENPALPKTVSGQLSEESKNVFTELFGNDASQKSGAMMNTVVAQSDKKGISYFGTKPKTPELSLKKFAKHSVKPGASILKAAVLILFLTAFGFGTQTSTRLALFGVNPALRLETATTQVDQLNAEVTVQRNLAAALLLDQFSSAADQYLYARAQAESAYTSTNKRESYTTDAATLKVTLVELLSKIQSKLGGELTPEQIALAVQVTDTLITQLQAQSGQVDSQSLLQEVSDLNTAKALLQNTAFRATISNLSLDVATDQDIQAVFDSFGAMNASLGATINSIQNSRIEWSFYLEEIESLTKKVEPLFNTEFQGSLLITDVVFGKDSSVSVAGSTNTDDTKNFTLISNLIDEYEDSPYFENVQERSYSKSGTEDSYSGSFRISMNLQTNPDSNE